MEAALEELYEKVDTVLTAKALTFLAPLVSELLRISYTQGLNDGRWGADAEARNRVDLRGYM
jgi:hypothetical protein